MDDQVNDQVQAVRLEVEELKEQMAKILEILTARKEKSVAGTSLQAEVGQNQGLEDTPSYPPGFTPPMVSNPHMAGMTYPTSFLMQGPGRVPQQISHVSDPVYVPSAENSKKASEDLVGKERLVPRGKITCD